MVAERPLGLGHGRHVLRRSPGRCGGGPARGLWDYGSGGAEGHPHQLGAARAGYVRQVVNFKKDPEDVHAPARYAQVMRQRREWAEAAQLNPDVIEGMYKLLVNNFIQEELEMIRQREAGRHPS